MKHPGRHPVRVSPCGPLLPVDRVRSCVACAQRGKECPLRAHAVAVGAKFRLRCGARPSVASQNSLRSLRSDSCAESVHEARYAHRLKACTPRCHRNRSHRAPPAALRRSCSMLLATPAPQQRRVRAGREAPQGRREAQGSWPRAKRESCSDSSQLSERRERSERREFGDGARRPSIAGQSARSADRSSEAQRPARTCLCHAAPSPENRRSSAATGGQQPVAALPVPCGSREAQWSR